MTSEATPRERAWRSLTSGNVMIDTMSSFALVEILRVSRSTVVHMRRVRAALFADTPPEQVPSWDEARAAFNRLKKAQASN